MTTYDVDEANLGPGELAIKEASVAITKYANSTGKPVESGMWCLAGVAVAMLMAMGREDAERAMELYGDLGSAVGDEIASKIEDDTAGLELSEDISGEVDGDGFSMSLATGGTIDQRAVVEMASMMANICRRADEEEDAIAHLVSFMATATMRIYGGVEQAKSCMDDVYETFSRHVPQMRSIMDEYVAKRAAERGPKH